MTLAEKVQDQLISLGQQADEIVRLQRKLEYALQALRDLGAEDVAEKVENYESSAEAPR